MNARRSVAGGLPAGQSCGPTRRRLLGGACGLCLVLLAGMGSPLAERDPRAFLDQMGTRAVELLADESKPKPERQEDFKRLLDDYFKVPAIGRFILGRYWRTATEQQQSEFIEVFKRVLADRFVPWFEGVTREQFTIGRVVPDANNERLLSVETKVRLKGGQVVNAVWRVERQNGGLQVFDILADGVSMALTLRSEYNSVLSRSNGDVDRLIELLEERLQQSG